MKFTIIMNEIRAIINEHKDILKNIKNQYRLYTELLRLTNLVGKKYNINIQLNFPYLDKLEEYESYGKENISIIIDKNRKVFPIKREVIKSKARDLFKNALIKDAYMYEGKEGVKVIFDNGRIDILPGSLHIWREIDNCIEEFCDWLMENVYKL